MTPLGALMGDIAGLALTVEEQKFLLHPMMGGVILFSRNYQDRNQLRALTTEIKAIRDPKLLIAVDHEGGRVQRFRDGFTPIPAMRSIGRVWTDDRIRARALANAVGVVMGHELAIHGVDFSFAPVLDIDYGTSAIIGDRSFSSDAVVVSELAAELVSGLARAGVSGVGKHFPGHGFVAADSHVASPQDERAYAEIEAKDLLPYRRVIAAGIQGIMPAHVIYPAVDLRPAGFSQFWIRDVLRQRLGFNGLVFSDDLTMVGASSAGDVVARGRSALAAGCDMILACNAPDDARRLARELTDAAPALVQCRAEGMRAKSLPRGGRSAEDEYRDAKILLEQLGT